MANVQKRQKSPNGKCHKTAIVPSRQKLHTSRVTAEWHLSQKGKILIMAKDLERQLSLFSKAIVLERQMSQKGKCLAWHLSQMAKGTFFKGRKGKCPKTAFVSDGKWPCVAFGT